MKNLSNTEAELKKTVVYKKACNSRANHNIKEADDKNIKFYIEIKLSHMERINMGTKMCSQFGEIS